jgi:sigma-B regulation protein RsbQ
MIASVTVLLANNVNVLGAREAQPMVFVHGMGCEQAMWQHVAPAFAATHRVVLYDHTGLGRSDRTQYDEETYASLHAYVDDLLAILEELDLEDAVLVGHSVGAIISAMAACTAPGRVDRLVLLNPSPRYVDDPTTDYRGGFSADDIEELLSTLSSNYLGWLDAAAPMIMQAPRDAPQTQEFVQHMCGSDPQIVRRFAEVTFRGDYRDAIRDTSAPALVLQSRQNMIAPPYVGEWVADALPGGQLQIVETIGNCPQLSAPNAIIDAIRAFVER